MTHRPKTVREIYNDSILVNLSTLENQLGDRHISRNEIEMVSKRISDSYAERLERLAIECDKDMMAIENAPSPLELFLSCISELFKNDSSISPGAASLLKGYVDAWEDWM